MGRRFARRLVVTTAVAGALLASLTLAAVASHIFSDVPTSAFYHSAVEWIFNRSITSGCALGLYCPDNPVLRSQMAVFMRNLGVALTPVVVQVDHGDNVPVPVDPDASPVLCQTAPFAPAGYPRTARIDAWVSLRAGGAMGVQIANVVSVNGGAFTPLDTWFSRGGASASGEWMHTNQHALVDLNVGTSYVFGVQVVRESGTADATDSRCETTATMYNRNGTVSPLSPNRHREGDR